MNKVQVLCGFPGSGKTKWARESAQARRENGETVYIISFDNIREMLIGRYDYNLVDETAVRYVALSSIKQLLLLGSDVIVDDCLIANTRTNRNGLCKLIRQLKEETGPVEIDAIIFERPVEKCIETRLDETKGMERQRWLKAFEEIVEAHEPIVDKENFDSVRTFTITH
jgi:predicted kinase